YLDDNDVVNGNTGDGYGEPDFNSSWGCAFVNVGDPLWFQEIDNMTYEDDGYYGLQEILTTSVGKGLGLDGVFMDALDTFGPNSWTDSDSTVQAEFEWTAPGFADFVERLKSKYPDKAIVQNRALFMLKPGYTQKYLKYSSRPYIDFLFFESFRLNSSSDEYYNETYYPDNLYNFAPPILAEASRDDGFQILSLGYCEGPTDLEPYLNSGASNDELIEDIEVTHGIGFRHYLTNINVDNLNTYVSDHKDLTDTEAPAWTSAYHSYSLTEPTANIGLARPPESNSSGSVTVYWDIAEDMYGADYYLYYIKDTDGTNPNDTIEFNFDSNPSLDGVDRVKLTPNIPDDYKNSTDLTSTDDEGYLLRPFYDTVTGFTSGQCYHFCIRAIDKSENKNMDKNTATWYLTVQ
ncbi:MAG: hypothetical protein PQJ46_01700, partial [Spirochaetales bacterium]|nr:hypothetical protein [Spirochaetales bacterium]